MIERKTDITQMTISQLETKFVSVYTKLILSGTAFKVFPSVMLWGPPGVGKSQAVKCIAEKVAERTGRKVVVTDVRLLLFNPVDLRGIPTANADKTLAVWLKPKIFQMDEREDVVNILFLDEISAAPQSVQAAAYQITLDRTIGEHKLPENCIVIAAGNRVTDKSVAYTMPKALANRLMHIEAVGNPASWIEWANLHGIHPYVIGFISYSPATLMEVEPSMDELAFPTPRSWEMVSNILNYVSDNLDEVIQLVAGCIGKDTAYCFKAWTEMYGVIPEISEVFDGSLTQIPKQPEVVLALTSQIGNYIQEHHSSIEVKNALDYVFLMPIEYRSQALTSFLGVKEIRKQLQNDDRFCNWFLRSGRDWDDYR